MDAGIVTIVSEQGDAVGCGVYDPDSPIAVRVWGIGQDARLDADVFADRLTRAIALRRELFADGATTAYRVLNGEGDRAPGFVIDRYGHVAVLRIDGDAARAVAPILLRDVEKILRDAGITTLLERTAKRNERGADEAKTISVRFGEEPKPIRVTEHGVPFMVDVLRGQKTGAFLDQRENRRRIGELVARRKRAGLGVRVLNLFSYTGGFSQRAALAGAIVTSVDVAAKAHGTAQESFKLAGIDPSPHSFVSADAFAWLAEQKKKGNRWDVVISDPPSFAPSERAKPNAISAYRSLHRACADVLAPGGTFAAASCSSHISAEELLTTLDDIALGRSDLRLVELFGPPPDHPSLPAFPEGRYLKLALLA
ncbi:MAG: m5C1962 methyltransferase RlmI [Labilithrix sp.]|nr:m5C1962 methyltransferase RlmI [Labilithrix sp.]